MPYALISYFSSLVSTPALFKCTTAQGVSHILLPSGSYSPACPSLPFALSFLPPIFENRWAGKFVFVVCLSRFALPLSHLCRFTTDNALFRLNLLLMYTEMLSS